MSDGLSVRSLVLRYGVTALVIVAAAVILTRTFDVGAAVATTVRANPLYLGAAVLSFYVTFPFRTARWRRFLAGIDVHVDRLPANLVLLVGFYFNVIVPAKLGDVYRSYLLARRTDSPISSVGGTIAAERVIDLLLLAAGLAVLLPIVLSRHVAFVSRIGLWAGGLLAVLAVGIAALFATEYVPLPERVLAIVRNFRRGFRAAAGRSSADRGWIVAYSVSIWGSNVVRTALVAAALGIELPLAEITLLALLVAFLSGLPYVPSGVGIVEVVGSGVLVTLGLSRDGALALILLDRFITVATLIGVGTVAYLYLKYVEGPDRSSIDALRD